MAIGRQHRYGAISRKNWEKFAHRTGVDLDRLAQGVSEVAGQLPDALQAAIDATPASEQRDETERPADRTRHATGRLGETKPSPRPASAQQLRRVRAFEVTT